MEIPGRHDPVLHLSSKYVCKYRNLKSLLSFLYLTFLLLLLSLYENYQNDTEFV